MGLLPTGNICPTNILNGKFDPVIAINVTLLIFGPIRVPLTLFVNRINIKYPLILLYFTFSRIPEGLSNR